LAGNVEGLVQKAQQNVQFAVLRHRVVPLTATHMTVEHALTRLEKGLNVSSDIILKWTHSHLSNSATTRDEKRFEANEQEVVRLQHALDDFLETSRKKNAPLRKELADLDATYEDLAAELHQLASAKTQKVNKHKELEHFLIGEEESDRKAVQQHPSPVKSSKKSHQDAFARQKQAMPLSAQSPHSPTHKVQTKRPHQLHAPGHHESVQPKARKIRDAIKEEFTISSNLRNFLVVHKADANSSQHSNSTEVHDLQSDALKYLSEPDDNRPLQLGYKSAQLTDHTKVHKADLLHSGADHHYRKNATKDVTNKTDVAYAGNHHQDRNSDTRVSTGKANLLPAKESHQDRKVASAGSSVKSLRGSSAKTGPMHGAKEVEKLLPKTEQKTNLTANASGVQHKKLSTLFRMATLLGRKNHVQGRQGSNKRRKHKMMATLLKVARRLGVTKKRARSHRTRFLHRLRLPMSNSSYKKDMHETKRVSNKSEVNAAASERSIAKRLKTFRLTGDASNVVSEKVKSLHDSKQVPKRLRGIPQTLKRGGKQLDTSKGMHIDAEMGHGADHTSQQHPDQNHTRNVIKAAIMTKPSANKSDVRGNASALGHAAQILRKDDARSIKKKSDDHSSLPMHSMPNRSSQPRLPGIVSHAKQNLTTVKRSPPKPRDMHANASASHRPDHSMPQQPVSNQSSNALHVTSIANFAAHENSSQKTQESTGSHSSGQSGVLDSSDIFRILHAEYAPAVKATASSTGNAKSDTVEQHTLHQNLSKPQGSTSSILHAANVTGKSGSHGVQVSKKPMTVKHDSGSTTAGVHIVPEASKKPMTAKHDSGSRTSDVHNVIVPEASKKPMTSKHDSGSTTSGVHIVPAASNKPKTLKHDTRSIPHTLSMSNLLRDWLDGESTHVESHTAQKDVHTLTAPRTRVNVSRTLHEFLSSIHSDEAKPVLGSFEQLGTEYLDN